MSSNDYKTNAYGYNPLEIRPFQNFYTYDDELYDKNFPREWAMFHHPGTGPKECGNCGKYGSWRGVFIGYCLNCANYVYHLERGSGFYHCGLEASIGDPDYYAMNTYLKDADFNFIGDIEMHPAHRADNNGKPIVTEEMKETMKRVNEEMDKEPDEISFSLFPQQRTNSIDSLNIIHIMRSLSEPTLSSFSSSSKLNEFNV
jgi:hypothetical protein